MWVWRIVKLLRWELKARVGMKSSRHSMQIQTKYAQAVEEIPAKAEIKGKQESRQKFLMQVSVSHATHLGLDTHMLGRQHTQARLI